MVRELGLTSEKEWKEWSKSGQRPSNIPSCPHQVYRDAGWVSMPDWLGYGVGRRPSRSSQQGKGKRKRVERAAAPELSSDSEEEEEEGADEHEKEETEGKEEECSSDWFDLWAAGVFRCQHGNHTK